MSALRLPSITVRECWLSSALQVAHPDQQQAEGLVLAQQIIDVRVDFLAVPGAGRAVGIESLALLFDLLVEDADFVLQLGDDQLVAVLHLFDAGLNGGDGLADTAANFGDGFAFRRALQVLQFGANFLLMIFAVGGDRFGEDRHGGGSVFQLLAHFLQLFDGFVAIFAKLAAERRLSVAELIDVGGLAALLLDGFQVLAELDGKCGVYFHGVVRGGVDGQGVTLQDGSEKTIALLDFVEAV